MADIQFNFNAKDLDEIKKLMDELLKISETISKNLATVGKYSEDDVKQLKKLTAEMKKLSAEKKKAELSAKQQAKAEADLANIEQKSAGRRAVNAKKIQNDLDAQEIRTRKIAIAQDNLNNKIARAGQNTNTWGKALDSFQFKFNALGNIAGMLSGQMANLAGIIGGKLLDSAGSFFTKTEKGMELMERKTAGFNAAMDVLNGKFADLGESIVGNSEEAIRWGAMIQSVLSQFGVVGDLSAMAFKGTADEMDLASKTAEELELKLQALEDRERSLKVERAEQNLVILEARNNLAENIGTQEEQLAGLKEAVRLEGVKADDELMFAKQKNDIIRAQIALQQQSMGVNDAQKDALIEMDIMEINMAAESIQRVLKANRQITALEKKINEDKTKVVQQSVEKEIRVIITQKDAIGDLTNATKEYMDLFKTSGSLWGGLIEASDELAKADEDNLAKREAGVNAYFENVEKKRQEDLQAEEAARQRKYEIAYATYDSAISITNAIGGLYEAQKENELALAGNSVSKKEAIEKKYAKKQQNIALALAFINTAGAITKSLQQFGLPLAIPFMAADAIAGGIQIAAIKAQKFAKGGEVGGVLHSQGGTHIEAERGEYVINRKSVGKYRGLIEGINEDNQMKMMEAMGRDRHLNIVNKQDIYTKKLYEHLVSQEVYGETPNFYVVQKGTKKTLIRK